MSQKATVLKPARFRSDSTMTTTDRGAESIVGFEFIPDAVVVDKNNPSIMMVKIPITAASAGAGKWLPVTVNGVHYTKLSDIVNQPPSGSSKPKSVTVEMDDGSRWTATEFTEVP